MAIERRALRYPEPQVRHDARPGRVSWPVLMGALTVVLLPPCGVTVRAARAERWTRAYIDSLPDSAFAVVETTPTGKKVRHLPHHDRSGRVDVPHLRNALSRLSQVKWLDSRNAAVAREHLRTHARETPEAE